MAANNPGSGVDVDVGVSSVNGPSFSAVMNPDIWHLVFGHIESPRDLYNACLTSRAWSNMAAPHLYKIVPLRRSLCSRWDWDHKTDPMVFAHSLSSRLLDTRNEQLRRAVGELDFGDFGDQTEFSEMEERLVALVHSLPNLRRVKIRGRLTQEALQGIGGHSKRIALHLLGEDGRRPVGNDLKNVVAIAAQVCPSAERSGPNRDILGLQKLLFACPNLTSFSLGIRGGYGGCVRRIPRFSNIHSFQFAGDETFPPLQELSLSGYRLSEEEWEHWQKGLRWSKLTSLALGPTYMADFLKLAAGYANCLQNLEVKVYTDDDRKITCPPLEHFLTTFTSLESLIVRGYRLPISLIGRHSGLRDLCLHTFERGKEGYVRPTLDIEQLQELDKACPNLETLEIDLYRDGVWPE
ncbi:hypothetical protein F5Y14DRAFT_397601 [Nemania sp. NC0429]|nr:hypothetical protein F5Y14DRAFT_397601 [Nemania sp. NC0429]